MEWAAIATGICKSVLSSPQAGRTGKFGLHATILQVSICGTMSIAGVTPYKILDESVPESQSYWCKYTTFMSINFWYNLFNIFLFRV